MLWFRIGKTKMSQIRVTDRRLIPQIKQFLEQSAGSLITESDVFDFILRKFPEFVFMWGFMSRYRRKNQTLVAKEISRAYLIAKSSLENNSEPISPVGNDNPSLIFHLLFKA